ncbi:MAG TPA: hypothetical protein VLW06_11175 [Terriglobales bacterium]|nr:hypothetical protein [Terriglobales bacterium]
MKNVIPGAPRLSDKEESLALSTKQYLVAVAPPLSRLRQGGFALNVKH